MHHMITMIRNSQEEMFHASKVLLWKLSASNLYGKYGPTSPRPKDFKGKKWDLFVCQCAPMYPNIMHTRIMIWICARAHERIMHGCPWPFSQLRLTCVPIERSPSPVSHASPPHSPAIPLNKSGGVRTDASSRTGRAAMNRAHVRPKLLAESRRHFF